MNDDELLKALETGESVGFVRHILQLTPDIFIKHAISLEKKTPDAALRQHSWHFLLENPSYMLEQKIIQHKPFLVQLFTVTALPQAMDVIDVYFADLNEVKLFIQQFGKAMDDFNTLSDEFFSE
jgi:hypothetical protein